MLRGLVCCHAHGLSGPEADNCVGAGATADLKMIDFGLLQHGPDLLAAAARVPGGGGEGGGGGERRRGVEVARAAAARAAVAAAARTAAPAAAGSSSSSGGGGGERHYHSLDPQYVMAAGTLEYAARRRCPGGRR